jgi:hypothetical protein
MASPTKERIRILDYELAGQPSDREDEFWYQAEKELRETRELEAIVHSPPPTLLPVRKNGSLPAANPARYVHFTRTM